MKFIILSLIGFFSSATAFAHGVNDADKLKLVSGGNIDYTWLGATHMLTGYDHLLFLFGVIFFLTRFKDIVKFITAFTLGHSITLILGTFFEIKANYYLIDAVIALSVCYKGFENLGGFQKYLRIKSPNLAAAVFVFGLIHGFGLSTRLQQLPLGDDQLIWKILSFNVGVEFGQIIALSVMLFLISKWRKTESFTRFSKTANLLLVFAGLVLFVFQISGFMKERMPVSKPQTSPSVQIRVPAQATGHQHGDGTTHSH